MPTVIINMSRQMQNQDLTIIKYRYMENLSTLRKLNNDKFEKIQVIVQHTQNITRSLEVPLT